ncbi:phage holin family protein [Candidatus Parcubacteria bacterium]|nr:phage holin family protein [Candidatus Parcubacteria bacterium]
MFAEQAVWSITDFATAFGTLQMQVIAMFLVADIILGIAVAIATKSFNFSKLANFMSRDVLPYLFGFAVVEMVASGFTTYGQIAATVVFVAIILKLLGGIISNLANLGVNMPSILKKAT